MMALVSAAVLPPSLGIDGGAQLPHQDGVGCVCDDAGQCIMHWVRRAAGVARIQ